MTKVVWRALLILVLLVPLPFGSFRPWSWSLAGILVSALVLAWAGLVLTNRITLFWRVWFWPPLLVYTSAVIWILIQALLPINADLAHPIWQLAGTALGQPLSPRISAAPEQGQVALIRFLTAGMIFWLVLQFARDRARAMELLRCFGIASAIYALYGLVNLIAGNDLLLWYPRTDYVNDVTGTFVNRNSYATFAGLGLLTLAVLFIDRYRRRLRDADPTLSWLGRRSQAISGWPSVYLVGALVVAMALLQSHSRMGLVSAVCGFSILLLLLWSIGQIRGPGPLIGSAILAIGIFVASGNGVADRIAAGNGTDRLELMATTQRAIASAPVLGSGFGGFASVFAMYRDASLPTGVTYQMAHNSYLEMAMDLGIPAAVLLFAALVWLTATALIGMYRRDHDRALPALAVAASVVVAVHSLLDFSLQIPGVQYTFMALLAMGVAQSFSQRAFADLPQGLRVSATAGRAS